RGLRRRQDPGTAGRGPGLAGARARAAVLRERPRRDPGEEGLEPGAELPQLLAVGCGQAGERAAAARGEDEVDPAAVVLAAFARDEAKRLQAVHEADGAVVPDTEALGQLADARPVAGGRALDREQRLVLARSQADGLGRGLARGEELADGVA